MEKKVYLYIQIKPSDDVTIMEKLRSQAERNRQCGDGNEYSLSAGRCIKKSYWYQGRGG
jgi:hypothetical protein